MKVKELIIDKDDMDKTLMKMSIENQIKWYQDRKKNCLLEVEECRERIKFWQEQTVAFQDIAEGTQVKVNELQNKLNKGV